MLKKRMTLALAALMALCLLAGCAKEPAPTEVEPVPSTSATAASTEATQATEPSEPSVPEATEESAITQTLYRNPLNGSLLEEPFTGRPYAVMHNNIVYAMPQVGISQADIHYEVLAEGGITRCIMIYSDISGAPTLGTIRSARPYYVEIAMSYDAIYVHAGGSKEADAMLAQYDVDDIDALTGTAGSYFYRDAWRKENAGYEHSLMIDSEDVLACAQRLEYQTEWEQPQDYGLIFSESAVPDGGEQAESIDVWFRSGGKVTSFVYDSETGLYKASQHGSIYIDGNTDQQLTFTNVLTLTAQTTTNDDGTLNIDLVGSGEGTFACGGKLIPIRWSRESETAPFVYTLADGSPLTLGVGRSYIAILAQYGSVDYE